MSSMKRIVLLGATGSIGSSTVEIVKAHPERFRLVAVSANTDVERLADVALSLRPEVAVIADPGKRAALEARLAGSGVAAAAGPEAVEEIATRDADVVVVAITGFAGLRPTIAAAAAGRTVALANKESLVAAGPLVLAAARAGGARLLPVDSEHNAIFQVLETAALDQVAKVILTASGGPFREWSREAMEKARPEEALRHPNWSMGAKITIDSATMMNKGLELIEAFHLFPLGADRLDVLVHPQSIVHGLVSYADGSTLAQLGNPDMKTPIAYCLNHPERGPAPIRPLDLARLGTLTFEAPDPARFPALRLARAALEAGGTAPAVLNGANEVAVAAFLSREIGFLDIAAAVETALEAAEREGVLAEPGSLEDVTAADGRAREAARGFCRRALAVG